MGASRTRSPPSGRTFAARGRKPYAVYAWLVIIGGPWAQDETRTPTCTSADGPREVANGANQARRFGHQKLLLESQSRVSQR